MGVEKRIVKPKVKTLLHARLTIELTAADYPVGIVMMDRINDMSYTSEPTEQTGFGREGAKGN